MIKVFAISATELVSGVDASEGVRYCALRLHVDGDQLIKVELHHEGPVQNIPFSDLPIWGPPQQDEVFPARGETT